MNVIARIISAVQVRRQARRVKAAMLRADNVESCLAAAAHLGEAVADRIAQQFGVDPAYNPYVTAMRVVADLWPGSWVDREVLAEQRRYVALIESLNLTRPVRV